MTSVISPLFSEWLPTTKSEYWRYTSLQDLEKIEFNQPDPLVKIPTKNGLLFVNGVYRPELSTLPEGVLVSSAPLKAEKEEFVSPLASLNAALSQDVLIIQVSGNITRPLDIFFVSVTEEEPIAIFPRLEIIIEKNARATIVEHHSGQGTQPYFTNAVIDVSVRENSGLEHYVIQREAPQGFHVSTAVIQLDQGAKCDSFIFHSGGKLARREVHATLTGRGADLRLNGAYIARDNQVSDITTFIHHAQPECRSREIVKGVIDGHARGVFQGKIHVAPGAQKTDGYQLNKALLLSNTAEIDSRPELEIYADDVKCSHGATAGELDENALFYLRARGIDEAMARHLLIQAFLTDVIDEIDNDHVRESLRSMISEQVF